MYANVLLVDDNQMLLRALTQTIDWERAGCRVCGVASNAIDGISQLSLIPPDVIITDIKMPGMSGIEFVTQAKNLLPKGRFIFITGYQEFEYAQAALRLGAVDILLKPIRNADVFKALNKALQSWESHGSNENRQVLTQCETLAHLQRIAVEIVLLLGSYSSQSAERYFDAVKIIGTLSSKAVITDYMEDVLRDFRSHLAENEKNPLTDKLLEYVQMGYNGDISLSSAAEMLKISQGYLSRLIKADTGRNFTELLLERRIEKAKALLRQSNSKATDVAFEVGYSEYGYFYRVFKKNVGISPNEYKKMY